MERPSGTSGMAGISRPPADKVSDLTPPLSALRIAAHAHSHKPSPRRDRRHGPAAVLGPLLDLVVGPHPADAQMRDRRREVVSGDQLRHSPLAQFEHRADLLLRDNRGLLIHPQIVPTRVLPPPSLLPFKGSTFQG